MKRKIAGLVRELTELSNKSILFIVVVALAAGFYGCGKGTNSNKVFMDSREVLRVYNATDYIDKTTIADFENEFNIKVIYNEFESNEDMYDYIVKNPKSYDVLVPSDYTIDRLIQENLLAKLDLGKIPNISHVAPQYLKPEYDSNNDYVVPYMVGTLGILYNKRLAGAVESWDSLFDSRNKGRIFMWDSQRDVIGLTLKMLGYSMNSNDDNELTQAKERLKALRSFVQYGGDEIRDIMIADEGILALVYSGDAKTAIDQNPRLTYVIPKEGSNKWVDGFVIMKNTEHLEAAHNFINFMCRPNIAIRNITKTGYTSPIFGAWEEFGGNPIMFPAAEELNRCEPYLYNREAAQKYGRLWAEVR